MVNKTLAAAAMVIGGLGGARYFMHDAAIAEKPVLIPQLSRLYELEGDLNATRTGFVSVYENNRLTEELIEYRTLSENPQVEVERRRYEYANGTFASREWWDGAAMALCTCIAIMGSIIGYREFRDRGLK